jgi:CHAD domain-containing protein
MLNLLRDTQVQIIFIRRLIVNHPILERFLALLLYNENETVNKMYRKLSELDFEEIEGLAVFYRLDIKNKLTDDEFIKRTIKETLETYYQNICGLIEQIDRDNPATIHKLRLAFKKFRYTIEALEPIINVTKHDLKVLHAFQTVMGKIQDNCIIHRNLSSHIENQIIIPKVRFSPVLNEILRQRELLINSFMNRINIISNFWESKRTDLFKNN